MFLIRNLCTAVTNGDGTFDLHGDGADDTERAAQMEDKVSDSRSF